MIINEVKFNMEHCTNDINNAPLKKVFTEIATPRTLQQRKSKTKQKSHVCTWQEKEKD